MILHGKCINPGSAIGIAFVHDSQTLLHHATSIQSSDSPRYEIERFRAAVGHARTQLDRLQRTLTTRGLKQDAAIFSVHASVLSDDSLTEQIETQIASENASAEAAVARAVLDWHTRFSGSPHVMVQEKAYDILDIGQRIVRCLGATQESDSSIADIIVATEITPSELVRFAHIGIQAIIAETCGMKSHVAILARGFGIPMVAGVTSASSAVPHGSQVLLDGESGMIVVDPDENEQETAAIIATKANRLGEQSPKIQEPTSSDGERLSVLLNISDPIEAEMVSQLGADGVGLYRTEFLYLDYDRWPTEAESYTHYQRVAHAIGDRELCVRLADFGAEKSPRYADIPVNRNPSLGIRGMRLLLGREDVMRPQILALKKLSHERPVTLLLPMIDTADTLQKSISRLCEYCQCREREQLPFRIGIMIEVPSAAYLISDLIVHVDSISIGLNDLTQYMLAADRDDELMEAYHDPLQPAVLRIVAETIRVADTHNKPVTMCGELAGDCEIAVALVALGARRFSVSRSHYRGTVNLIRNMAVRDLSQVAGQLLQLTSAESTRRFLSELQIPSADGGAATKE